MEIRCLKQSYNYVLQKKRTISALNKMQDD